MEDRVCNRLYDDGRQYDQLFAPEATGGDLEFYLDLGRRTGGTVLELACGTGRVVIVTHSYTYERHTQIKRITTYHQVGDAEEVASTLDMRMYYPQEFDLLLEYCGLSIEHKYGGYDQSPFGAESPSQVVVCHMA